MRLKTVRLAGFKSFVDPISIPISGNLIGVVGPNGSGKSNIVDAVRWVMGEMSAKHLRGDSMADVIFNGSNSRKPVGKASVELVFDNADGSAGGEYAKYAEISIRRETGRDGQSDYFLNKTRCRRKDITNLFLGTGLGPRAYSIIEQGMITRIVEAKPEELRGFIEEAAGISKYKERRHETENRIKHTRENLARVEDIRKELESQLARLQRQSKAAAKYKELKRQERLTRAQLLALKWRELNEQVEQQDAALMRRQTELDGVMANLRAIEAEIEKIRSQQADAIEHHNTVQAEFYSVGSEISRMEQAIEHARETREAQLREQEQLNRAWAEASHHLEADLARLDELENGLEQSAPQLDGLRAARDAAAAALHRAERAVQEWRNEWDRFAELAAEPAKVRDIQRARMDQLRQHVQHIDERGKRLAEESSGIAAELHEDEMESLRDHARSLDEACESEEQMLADRDSRIRDARAQREELSVRLDELRGRAQNCDARLASLDELQRAAEGAPDAAMTEWLRGQGLESAPRLASILSVEPGWEGAVERVLGATLAAVCVSELREIPRGELELNRSQLTLIDRSMRPNAPRPDTRPALLDKVKADLDLAPLLSGIYIAESLEEALAERDALADLESIITRDAVWVGHNWMRLGSEAGERSGWIERSREMDRLQAELVELQEEISRLQSTLGEAQGALEEMERERDEWGRKLSERNRERAQAREQLGHKEARFAQLKARLEQIENERSELEEQSGGARAEIETANSLMQEAELSSGSHEQRRAELQEHRGVLQDELSRTRAAETQARDALHRIEVERQAMQTEFDSTRNSIARLEGQLKHLTVRRDELDQALSLGQQPEAELQERLNAFLQQRLQVEARLNEARKSVSELEHALRQHELERQEQERHAQAVREGMESEKVLRQGLVVRRDTHADQVREAGFDLEPVLADMPPEAAQQEWQDRLERLGVRIERLGPINLVAIEEYEEQSQRKGYLDKQYDDLIQALTTLEEAMRKIDRETRTRFKETFEKVNEGFQKFFPQLFGGGSAYLDLTDNDLLETGVTVMGRPPGKRNSTIHLLSGGEKALTAVALLFSIFQLNPAPFCLLDEVDAPLDDANVERYCETLKTMSGRTQLVYVTHNKISMEMADILVGVTMSEPGVSRLVAVDVEGALEMVAQ